MATYNLKRFSNPDGLKTITLRHLVRLLSPFAEFLSDREFELPKLKEAHNLDYEQLAAVLGVIVKSGRAGKKRKTVQYNRVYDADGFADWRFVSGAKAW